MILKDYFTKDLKPRQRQYEAIRAIAFGESTIDEIAERFDYSPRSLDTMVSKVINGKHILFPDVKTGPKGRRSSKQAVKEIIDLRRKKRLSAKEIAEKLKRSDSPPGTRTVERILRDAGFSKLCRRTGRERAFLKKACCCPKDLPILI